MITKLTFAILFAGNLVAAKAQYLQVKGSIMDERGHRLNVEYMLNNGAARISEGGGSDLKMKVSHTGLYSITFKKEGYESKTVYFSTLVRKSQKSAFNLNVTLRKLKAASSRDSDSSTRLTNVYYDGTTHAYCYVPVENKGRQ